MEKLERLPVLQLRTQAEEDWMAQCRKELVKLQAGDPENLALWQEFIQLSGRIRPDLRPPERYPST